MSRSLPYPSSPSTAPRAPARAPSAASSPRASAGTCSTAARCTGWWRSAASQRNLDPDDVEEHVAVARSMRVEFGSVGAGEEQVLLDGQDVTQQDPHRAGRGGGLPGGGLARGQGGPDRTGRGPSPQPPDWWPTGGIWARSSFRGPS